jgi:hypothetical protein
LIQSLERIEKKLDKESDSIKLGSHRSPDEKRKSRSVGRHHHHSQGNSKRKAHSSSIPYPTRNHKRSIEDELKGEMKKIKNCLHLMESTKRMKMFRHGFLACGNISNYRIIPLM